MSIRCSKCGTEMKSVSLHSRGGYAFLEGDEKGFLGPRISNIKTFVCTGCGYVEMHAEIPEVFQE